MGYYRGDYYRGDYRRGDPGFFDFIKSAGRAIGHVVGGAIGGFAAGGPAGAIAGAVGGAVSATNRNIQEETLASGGTTTQAQSPEALVALHARTQAGAGGRTLPSGIGMGIVPAQPMALMSGGPGQRRLHPNKSTYVTRGGGTSRWPSGLQVHVKGTEAVPSRRMNVADARALRRALRRVAGFGKIVHRVRRAVMRAATAVGGHRRTVRKGVARR